MKILFLLFLVLTFTSLKAQNRPIQDRNKISHREADSIKISILSRELYLNQRQANLFWPIYEKKLQELKTLNKEYFTWFRSQKDRVDQMSNPEINYFLQRLDNYLQQKLEIRRVYEKEFRRILNPNQMAHLYLSEDKFAREIVQFRINKGLGE